MMKLARLSRFLPGVHRGAYRFGPRQITAITKLKADPGYALRELLNAVQELAHSPFQGEAQAQQAASALAAELEQLDTEAARRLCNAAPHAIRTLPVWNKLDTKA